MLPLQPEKLSYAKNQELLSKAAAAFDIKQISIAAALRETYDSQTKLRLLAMQAIEDDNGQAAIEYYKQPYRQTNLKASLVYQRLSYTLSIPSY